jgi:hypothetical protein
MLPYFIIFISSDLKTLFSTGYNQVLVIFTVKSTQYLEIGVFVYVQKEIDYCAIQKLLILIIVAF